MDVDSTLRLTVMLAAGASAVSSLEHLGLRHDLGRGGTWSWSIVRRDFEGAPRVIRRVFDCLARSSTLLNVAMLGASTLLLFWSLSAAIAVLLVGTIVMSVRFRGALGGGSDSMSVQVLAALLVAHLADHPSVTLGAVFFIAVQSVLSYVLAGAAKLRSSAWRRGAALQSFGRSHAHRPIPLIDRPWAAVAASWLVIGFECGFVLALSSPTRAVGFILLALVFHVANARMFGLGRFAWIWMSTYPAVYFAADFLGGAR